MNVIIERRTFYAKVGKSREVVDLSKQFPQGAKQAGLQASGTRILTDVTGKTDRVIVETGFEHLRDFEEMSQLLPAELTQGTLQQLVNVIDGAELELLRLDSSE